MIAVFERYPVCRQRVMEPYPHTFDQLRATGSRSCVTLSEVYDTYFLHRAFQNLRFASLSYGLRIHIKIIKLDFALLPLVTQPAKKGSATVSKGKRMLLLLTQ